MRKAGEEAYMVKAKELTGREDFPYLAKKGALEKYIKTAPVKTAQAPEKRAGKAKTQEKGKAKAKGRQAKKRGRTAKPTLHEQMGLSKKQFVRVAKQCIEAGEEVSGQRNSIRELLGDLYNPLQYINVNETDKNAKLPHDYQYTDASPHDTVEADTMFGNEIDLSTVDSKIDGYGKWMTSPDNPTFTKVIVNRLWKEVFGQGIFEPVDELTDQTAVSNPELLSYLEDLMRDLDYDQKAFQAILYNTATYQRESFTGEVVMGAPYYFQGPLLRRMSAEQIWDSLVALALPEADLYQPKLEKQLASIDRVRRIYTSLEERPFDDFMAMVEELAPLVSGEREAANRYRARMAEARAAEDMEKFQKLRREYAASKKEVERKISDVAYIHLREKVDSKDLLLAMGVVDVGSEMMPEESYEDSSAREVMTKLPKPDIGDMPGGLQAEIDSRKGAKGRTRGKGKAKGKGKEMAKGRSKGKGQPAADRESKMTQREFLRDQKAEYSTYRNLIAGMARASELPSPAKRGHRCPGPEPSQRARRRVTHEPLLGFRKANSRRRHPGGEGENDLPGDADEGTYRSGNESRQGRGGRRRRRRLRRRGLGSSQHAAVSVRAVRPG
jgi:hypothetical protein